MLNGEYKNTHAYYTKADGSLAVGLYLVSMAIFYGIGMIFMNHQARLFVPASIVGIVAVAVVIFIRKGAAASVGLSGKNLGKSALLGLGTGAVFFFSIRWLLDASVIERAYGGATVNRFFHHDMFFNIPETPFLQWFPMIFLFIIITVLHQEVLMRGFVQTRLQGLLKSDTATTIVSAFLFVLFYMPLHAVITGMSFSWVLLASLPLTMVWMLALHFWLNFLHRCFNNLAAPIIFHIFFSFHSTIILTHSYYLGIG